MRVHVLPPERLAFKATDAALHLTLEETSKLVVRMLRDRIHVEVLEEGGVVNVV